MQNVTRRARTLATVILCVGGFALLATAVEAVPTISPTGAARIAQEDAAQEKALETREQATTRQESPRMQCVRGNTVVAQC